MRFELTTLTLAKLCGAVFTSIHVVTKGQIIVHKQYSNGGKELL